MATVHLRPDTGTLIDVNRVYCHSHDTWHNRLKRTRIKSETDNTKRMFPSCFAVFMNQNKRVFFFFFTFERGLILFQSSLVSNFFGFFNLILFSGSRLTNVALNKPATQSTYHGLYGRPENVVDGNKNTSISQCTHTAFADSNPDRWWRVDLQGMFEIHTVVITNRGDCCGE